MRTLMRGRSGPARRRGSPRTRVWSWKRTVMIKAPSRASVPARCSMSSRMGRAPRRTTSLRPTTSEAKTGLYASDYSSCWRRTSATVTPWTWQRKGAQARLVVLKDAEVDLEAPSRAVGWHMRDWLPNYGQQERSRAARLTGGGRRMASGPT